REVAIIGGSFRRHFKIGHGGSHLGDFSGSSNPQCNVTNNGRGAQDHQSCVVTNADDPKCYWRGHHIWRQDYWCSSRLDKGPYMANHWVKSSHPELQPVIDVMMGSVLTTDSNSCGNLDLRS